MAEKNDIDGPRKKLMLPDLKAHTIRHMLGIDNAHILEIGASDGTDTVEFLEAFPKGFIDCFECDPRAIRLWHRNIPGDHPRATLWEAALGDKIGKATFHCSGGRPPGARWEGLESWYHSGSLLEPDRHTSFEPWLTFPKKIEVDVTTLDAMLGDTGDVIDFCWVDAQGSEADILRGAQNIIRRVRYWYCECTPRPYYRGQATLHEIRQLLPGFVFKMECEGWNFLFENRALNDS